MTCRIAILIGWLLGIGLGCQTIVHGDETDPVSPVVLIETHWEMAEDWVEIRKTKYVWWARVQNRSDSVQKVSIYYQLVDGDGNVLDRNLGTGRVGPRATAVIRSDSYIDTSLLSRVAADTAELKSRPAPP